MNCKIGGCNIGKNMKTALVDTPAYGVHDIEVYVSRMYEVLQSKCNY